jgi:glycosyltransferase domain-containing protein
LSVCIIIFSNLDQRRDWLIHRLSYLALSGFEGQVLVGVWGGHDKIPIVERVWGQTPRRCQVSIVAQNTAAPFFERMVDLAERSQSDFLVMQGDDDFIVPAALVRPLEKLRCDPTVVAAQGRCVTVNLDGGLHRKSRFMPFPVWEAVEENVIDRYANLMKHYSFTWHALYRKHQFIERARYMMYMQDHAKNFIFSEAIGDLYSVIKGKIFIFNELFLVRGEHQNNASKTLRSGINFTMPPYLLLSPAFSETYKCFEGKCIELFESMGVNAADEDTRRRILDGMLDFMGRLFFKIRDRLDPDEVPFQKSLANSTNAGFLLAIRQIFEAREFAEQLLSRGGDALQ